MSRITIHRIESGKWEFDYATLAKLAAVLGMTLSELLDESPKGASDARD